MKGYRNRLFAIVLSLAMIVTNMAGISTLTAFAAESHHSLTVKVVDENGNGIPGIDLSLKGNNHIPELHFNTVTNQDGIATYECDDRSELDEVEYTLTSNTAGYVFKDAPVVVFGINSDWASYVLSVNGEDFDGSPIQATAVKGGSDTPSTPTVDRKTLNVKVVDKAGDPVEGLYLRLTPKGGGAVKYFENPTNADGKTSYKVGYLEGDYDLALVDESKYMASYFHTVTFNWEVSKYDGADYTGEATFVVEKIGGGDTSATDNISSMNIKVVDKDDNPVSGIALYLNDTFNAMYDRVIEGVSAADGKLVADLSGLSADDVYDTFILKPAKTSGYTATNVIEVNFGYADGKTHITAVNGVAYTGSEVVLTVKPNPPAPVIESVTANKTTVSADGEMVEFTVRGQNLTDTLYYKRWFVDSSNIDNAMDAFSAKSVEATGDSTERTFSLKLPSKADEMHATAWKVGVSGTKDGEYTKCSAIAIGGGTVANPMITKVETSKTEVSSNGDRVTVTVTGKDLPETLYYQVYYNFSSYDISTATAATAVTTTGTDTERHFDVDIPSQNEYTTESWKVGVRLTASGTLVKSAPMTVVNKTPDQPEEPTVDKSKLVVKAVDDEGKPVKGVKFVLKGTDEVDTPTDYEFKTATNAEGSAEYKLFGMENAGVYNLVVADGSEYTADAQEVVIDYTEDWDVEFSAVNGEAYTGSVEVVVKSATPVVQDPVITKIEVPEKLSTDAKTATVIVKGENLPDTLWAKADTIWMDGEEETKTLGNFTEYEATGSDNTEKTITINLGSSNTVVRWEISVKPIQLTGVTEEGKATISAQTPDEPVVEPVDASKFASSLSYTTCTYSGSYKKPAVKVTDKEGNVLTSGTDYTVSYANNKLVGKATVTVKFKGNYEGKIIKTFKIYPKKTSISKLKRGKKSFKASWKKVSAQVTGYQVRYSTKSNMSRNKTVTVKSFKTTAKTVKKLKKGKKYYVQVRTYKTVNGVKYCSAWSAKKSVRTR